MTRDRKILYALAATVMTVLLITVLFCQSGCTIIAAAWLAASAITVFILVKKRKAPSLHYKTVILIVAVFGLLYLSLFYLSGLYFGFVKTTVPFNFYNLMSRFLPSIIVIVATELIRRILLSQDSRGASVIAYTLGILSDIALAGGLFGITYFSAIMDMAGKTLFPAVSAGFLCQFLSARYGMIPSIVFRLTITYVPSLIPILPNLPDAIIAFSNLFIPIILLLFINLLFGKHARYAKASAAAKKVGLVSAIVGFIFSIGFISLISCQFRFGAIVIASGSMTDELNVGDVVVYERYEGQNIDIGDILVFERNKTITVHRVVDITHINGQTRYYTKGDANKERDVGFIISSDIVGIVDFKISYIGHPSLWLRRVLEFGT